MTTHNIGQLLSCIHPPTACRLLEWRGAREGMACSNVTLCSAQGVVLEQKVKFSCGVVLKWPLTGDLTHAVKICVFAEVITFHTVVLFLVLNALWAVFFVVDFFCRKSTVHSCCLLVTQWHGVSFPWIVGNILYFLFLWCWMCGIEEQDAGVTIDFPRLL